MFEINPSRKIQKSENVKSDNNIQQRAFLDEPQDKLELSYKKKNSVSFGAAIRETVSNLLNSNKAGISPKAVKVLAQNGLITDGFQPEENIYISDTGSFSDMPTAFQRKLAIDMYRGKPNDSILNHGLDTNTIKLNSEGKPEEIKYYEGHKLTHTEIFEYAHKRDGSPVLVKQQVFRNNNDDKTLEHEINFHKHHNGAVTITSSDGRQMSYSLRMETIRDYNNTPKTTNKPKAEVQQPKSEKPFVKPNPLYPTRDYTYSQKNTIESKFDQLLRSYDKDNDPNDKYAFMYSKPVREDLELIKKLVLETKDPKIQDEILALLPELKDQYDIPTDFVGNYKHINVYDKGKLIKIYKLAKLGALIQEGAATYSKSGFKTDLENKFIYTHNSNESFSYEQESDANSKIQLIMSNDSLSEAEKNSKSEEVAHKMRLNILARNAADISREFPHLKGYLSDKYFKPNLSVEQRADLEKIEKVRDEGIIFPQYGSNFTFDALENFSKLSETAKEHYLNHPDMCKSIYLYPGDDYNMLDSPYDVLSNLSEDEWNKFEKRNIADILDIVTGYNVSSFKEKKGQNIHKVLDMSDNDWKKLNDFGLLKLGVKGDELSFQKHRNLTFDFDEMQTIIDKLSYKDWENAEKRGLTTMTSDWSLYSNNFGLNIGVPVLVAAAKAPDSTFRFLQNIGAIKKEGVSYEYKNDDSMEHFAKGIEFLSKSHSNVYDNVMTMINNNITPERAIEILGVGAKNYNRFGKYMTEKVIELKEHYHESHIPTVLPMYLDFQSVRDKSDINELSIEEKRALLKNLIKYNALMFEHNPQKLLNSPILPKNKEEYCTILPKLVKSIGIDVRPVTRETVDNFVSATADMADKDSEFLNTRFTKDEPKLELEYPRDEFVTNVLEKVSDLPDTEKMKVYDYFGFDIKPNRDNILQMHGYPININNGSKLAAIEDETTRAVVEEVRPLVEKFSHNNKVTIQGKPEFTQQINDILELFPEFRTTIGKEQHGTHDFTVDMHTLKVLQGVMSDPRYPKLSDEDKKLLNIATLLHDLTKAEKTVDKTHPSYSAYDAYHIVSKMNMPEKDKIRVYQIIKNHDWLEKYNGKVKVGPKEYREHTPQEKDAIAKNIAFELKDGNNFELANILTKADMNAVKEDDAFFRRFEDAFYEATSVIEPLVENIQQTAIPLPQTKIPKASELKVDGQHVQEYTYETKDGKELKYKRINLEPDMDLGELGFEKGLNSNDLNVIVHALDEDTQSATFQALGSIDSDALLSSSYVNYAKGNYHVFRQQGFILDVNSADIQAGTYKDFGSGYGKDLDTLKSEYLFNGMRKNIRNFMSDNLKKRLNLSDKEYQKLYPEIADKSITELDKSNPKVAKSMREMFKEMEIHKRKNNRDYNEWLVSRPKIQGVFIQSSKYRYENPPEFLIKYAADNDLPVIYFGE